MVAGVAISGRKLFAQLYWQAGCILSRLNNWCVLAIRVEVDTLKDLVY